MSEEKFIGDYAPKRIWVDEHSEWWPTHSRSDTTPYIREDVVLELVEALERLIAFHDDLDYGYSRTIELDKAALAKWEENEDEMSPELREGMRKWAEARAINGLKALWGHEDE